MKPSDIAAMTSASDPQLSPDGQTVAYVVNRVDKEQNTYRSQIWVTAADGRTAPRALTSGDHRDSQPRWSPDGTQLAFSSSRATDASGRTRSTLHLLPFGVPGETVTLATGNEGFGNLSFSPNGAWLAVTHRVRGEHYDSDDIGRRPPRKLDHLNFSLNGEGFTIDRPSHVHVIATDGSTSLVNLTPGPDQFGALAWLPNSSTIAASINQHRIDYANDVCLVAVDLEAAADEDATTVQLVTNGGGNYTVCAVTPDGEQLIVSGFDGARSYPHNSNVGTIDIGSVGATSTATPNWFTNAIDRTWTPFTSATHPTALLDGSVLAAIEDRGNSHLYRANPAGGQPEALITGDLTITDWSAQVANGVTTIAYTATTRDHPAELFVLSNGETTQLTSVSAPFLSKVKPVTGEHFLAPSDDVEVDAWIFRPKDFDPAKKYPALLNIHGGPFTQYGNYFFDEFQMQANAGYVVLCSNPRGSSGRENSWGQATLGPKHDNPGTGWGGADFDDCMAVVDAALAQFDFIDADRLGVLGGSYGGYMTSWITTHDDRFGAACSERAVNNLLTLESHCDIAGVFSAWMGPAAHDDPQDYLDRSPITYVEDLNTPLLILHSEQDLRCPVDQATQFYVACQLLGKEDVEYYLFPGENHELSRTGTPIHRKQRAEIILEFFDRHLGNPA